MSELQPVQPLNPSPFKCLVATVGNIPTSFAQSLSYFEALQKLAKYIQDILIPALNDDTEAIVELQAKYIELKNYVDHYFDNLDVQEEINNKLDAMAEAGTLEEIIGQYIHSSALLGFDTVSDMKNAENIIVGSYCQTLGYHAKGDGGAALYKIRKVTNDDDINERTLIEITSDPQNELVAEFILKKSEIFAEQFGAYGDNIHDDSSAIAFAIDYAASNGIPLIMNKRYAISTGFTISSHNLTIRGNRSKKNVQNLTDNYTITWTGDNYLFSLDSGVSGFLLENISIKGNGTNYGILDGGFRNTYLNVTLYNLVDGIYFNNTSGSWRGENCVKQCFIDSCSGSSVRVANTADSEIIDSIFLGTGYAVDGTFVAWKFSENHDYTQKGLNITTGIDCQILNNYFDHADALPMISIHAGGTRGFQILNNKFLTGGATITNHDGHGIINYVNTDYGANAIINNNMCIGSAQGVAFIKFTGTSRVDMSCTGNIIEKVCNKLFENINTETISYSPDIAFKTTANISENVNTNVIYIKGGQAHILLDISNAPNEIELPFNSVGVYQIEALNLTDGGSANVRIGQISGGQPTNLNKIYTNVNGLNGKRILINAAINVYRGNNLDVTYLS